MCSDDKVDAVVIDGFVEGSDNLGLSAKATRITVRVGPCEGHDINKNRNTVNVGGTMTDIEENVSDFVAKEVRKVSGERIRFVLRKEIRVINGIACETIEGRFSELNRDVLDLVVLAFSHGCVVVEESVVCS